MKAAIIYAMEHIVLLGRQPDLGLAELERVFGAANVTPFSDVAATVRTDDLDVQALGGAVKAGRIVQTAASSDWKSISASLLKSYGSAWADLGRKQTLGISVYGPKISPRDIQALGLSLKKSLKQSGTSLRLIPNTDQALSSAVSHHNKLGLSPNKVELLVFSNESGRTVIAESVGAQNITALARRDQERPKRDAFVGMLPPKLALMMVNLANPPRGGRVLDPFCGTGVVLQEALLQGYSAYGSDLSQKMVEYSQANLEWLNATHRITGSSEVRLGDAIETVWQPPVDGVVSETYLGQPFSAPPAPDKLDKVRRNCDHIISQFLENLAPQLKKGTPLCLAVPAWRDVSGRLTRLRTVERLGELGYEYAGFGHVNPKNLVYYREDQVVARQLLVLVKT